MSRGSGSGTFRDEFSEQPALADARLATDQAQSAAPGARRFQRTGERSELARAADKCPALGCC
jgi:hypothetical protein